MASAPSLLVRVLQAIIYRVWTFLFFLTSLALVCLANHWWSAIHNGYGTVTHWIMVIVDALKN